MGVRYDKCLHLESHNDKYAGKDPDQVIAQIFASLYPKIWDLVNDKKYFRKSKRHGVLYSIGHKQHVFEITGSYFAANSCMGELFRLFGDSRLGKYAYRTHDRYQMHWNDYWCFRITPYIVIKTTSVLNRGSKSVCSWKYGIFDLHHVMGFTRNLCPSDKFLVQIPYSEDTHTGRYLRNEKSKYFIRHISPYTNLDTSKNKCGYYSISYEIPSFSSTQIWYRYIRQDVYKFFKYFDIVLLYMGKVSAGLWSPNRLWDVVEHTIMDPESDTDKIGFMEYATERTLV